VKLGAALTELLPAIGEAAAVFANGYISRAGFALGDGPGCFYMLGSMGLAAPIGLGLATAQPQRRVVVFDGDGNLLMNLGELATVAALAPRNFVHVVFDNEAYASTGNQPTLSAAVDLAALAAAAGYAHTGRAGDVPSLRAALPAVRDVPGPNFLLVKLEREDGTAFGRVAIEPAAMTARVRAWCASAADER
jgi:thiamine pyrophosphate-dependent acetolactate synthase large subunit-like protein